MHDESTGAAGGRVGESVAQADAAPGVFPEARVCVIAADVALTRLLVEWLTGQVDTVLTDADDPPRGARFDLIVVDVPFPRQGGLEMLKRLATEYPGTPILALSSHFFGNIHSSGAAARALGVASVLPKPVKREALRDAVRALLLRA